MNIFLMAFPVTALPQAALLARGYLLYWLSAVENGNVLCESGFERN